MKEVVENAGKVIASYCISNNASLNIYNIEYGINDRVLAGINNHIPEWYTIYTDQDGDWVKLDI